MDPASERPAGIAFGRFQVSPDRREVLADGRPVKLGGRAFDVLMALIEARGAVVSKNALMERVWPGRIIEENSLAAQIAALRAAFGAERALIRTVSGRGYQFTGEIRFLSASPEKAGAGMAAGQPSSVLPPANTPKPVSELIGRDAEVDEVLRLAGAHRLVTLTGAGGIGKTTLALALARELRPHFPDGVWLAEFSALADPGLVPATVAAAVGLDVGGGEASAQRVAQALAGRRLLLVLDTCEHVIDAAAAMAEAALGAGSALHIIVTSREPLRAGGEWVYPVQPLAVPALDLAADDDPLRYGAVRLFTERARAAERHFAPDRRLMAIIIAICRQLDGIPLAIELAAARASALGIEALAARLDDRFRLLTGGRRTALPRHQALRATFDWGYKLLAEPERVILRRLAAFAGPFSLEAAGAVAASPELQVPDVIERLLGLVAKSLVVAEGEGAVARYRLLDTTRDYALEKLDESGERERLSHHHAEYYRHLFEHAEVEWETRPAVEWLDDYGWCIDNLRAALDWAFSPGGDASIGVALTAAAVPLWMHLSLLEECRGRVERALTTLVAGEAPDARREMKLHAALAVSVRHTRGASPEISVALTRALDLAESLDDAEYLMRSLRDLWSFHIGSGQYPAALALAQRFCTLAANRSDPDDRLIGKRLIGIAQHYLGDQKSARRHLDRVFADDVIPGRRHVIRFQIDPHVAARVFLARILWLQGFPDQAMRTAEDVRAADHGLSFCYALALGACLIALLVGDLAATEHYAGMLLDHSTRHSLARWRAYGRCHQGALAIKRGDLNAGLRLLRAGFDELGGSKPALRVNALLMAEALGRAGQTADGLAAVEEALAWAESTGERWAISEVLRLKGELLLLQGAPGAAAAAKDHFRQALDWARQQGALSWELRAATSLARLRCDQGRPTEAMALLQPVYDRFTEGFDTTDLKAAKTLLEALPEPSAPLARIS
jgi:predicted ATPase/DNA-binding winged helix-turn-helix (wHTH) protein